MIGLPGDTIEMRGKHLLVNGDAADYADLGLSDEPLAARGVKALHLEEEPADNRHEIQWLAQRGHARRLRPDRRFRPIST